MGEGIEMRMRGRWEGTGTREQQQRCRCKQAYAVVECAGGWDVLHEAAAYGTRERETEEEDAEGH